MAKVFDEPITRKTDWGGDETTGGLPVSGNRVQEFIKDSLNHRYGFSRITADNIMQFFASSEDAALYDDDPITYAELLLGAVDMPEGGSSEGPAVTVAVINNLTTRNLYASKGNPCYINFTFTSKSRADINDTWVDTGERGRVEISVRPETADTFVVKNQFWTNSNTSVKLDVSNYLETGANSVMVKVTGEQTNKTTIALVYTVQLTSLSLADSGFAWWIAQKSDIIIPLRIGGNISKILNVKVSDNYGTYAEEYHINLYNNTYLETAYNYKLLHPNITGVFKVELYVSNADGQLKTNTLTYNIMCVVAGQEESLFVVNNLIETPTNWVQNKFCEYAVYNGGQETSSFTATITKEENTIYNSEQIINCEQKYALTTELEVETIDDSNFEIDLQLSATELPIQYNYKLMCDNSLGFSAVAGAEMYINPKKRTNEQLNKEVIINEIDSSQLRAVWNGFNWGSDGWVEGTYGRCLKVLAGKSVVVDWIPFATEVAGIGKSIEFAFVAQNIIDPSEPIISIFDSKNNIGIKISPEEGVVLTSALKDTVNQSVQINSGEMVHIMIVVMPDSYGNDGFNLCIVYINGVKNREFLYENNDYFRQSGQLTIGSTSADIELYGVRGYPTAITADGALQNRINWLLDNESKNITRGKNNVLSTDGTSVDFEKCKALFNVFTFDKEFPSYTNQNKMLGTLEVFYKDKPECNFVITSAPCDGQGTTSMKYYLWNIRFKLNSESLTTYADGTTENGVCKMFPTQPKIQRITFKKNFASSMQSHKMGSVNSITDLFATMGMANEANARISTYQEPFIGFRKIKGDDGTISYEFMGIYTGGADKGDKNTFSYDKKQYPNYFSIEGSDNAPLMSLFRVPYNPNKNYVAYNPSEEALQYNGANSWDYNSGTADSEDAVASRAKFDAQWAEPYNFVYTCSPRIKPFDGTIDELNAQVLTYRTEPYEYWCSDYNLYYYEASEGKYIPSDIGEGPINLKDQLGITPTGTLEEQNQAFINARVNRFKEGISNYFDVDDAIFADIWVEFNAGTDNRAKNTYPYIFGLLTDTNSEGKAFRWRWRHDDTDTIFDITNQGQALKPYYAEVYDSYTNGQPVWNGETSVFWDLIERAFADRKKELAKKYMDAMATLSEKQGTAFEKLFAFYEKYYFNQAQKYFPETIYNADVKRTYETAKLAQIEGKYSNDTDPLTQSLGDHYSAEKRWISRRIIYMMSKYSWGMFSAENTDGVISVRASGNNITYVLTPSMWLYPAIANGTTIIRGERTEAGQPREMIIDLGGSADQQNNIMGANYLLDIGDWHDKSVSGTMTISGKMLRNITLGSDNAESVIISISALNLGNIAMLENIKLSNISTLSGTVDLRNAGRIKEVYADGTSITQIKLPSGSGLTTLSYGSSNQYVVLNNQKQLTSVDYSQCKEAVTTFAVSDCPNLDAFSMLVDIINAQNQAGSLVLKGVRLQGINYTSDSSAALETLAALANSEGFFGVDADGNPITGTLPQLSGKITINGYAYEDSVNTLREAFPNLTIEINGYYIKFEDPEVLRVLLANGVGDGVGILYSDVEKCNNIRSWFKGNTIIKTFNEFQHFTNVTLIATGAFDGCTSLESITLPNSIVQLESYFMRNCSSLTSFIIPNGVKEIPVGAFEGCLALESVTIPNSVTTLNHSCFQDCSALQRVEFPDSLITLGQFAFQNSGLISLVANGLEEIAYNALNNCVNMTEIVLPSVQRGNGENCCNKPKLTRLELGTPTKKARLNSLERLIANDTALVNVDLSNIDINNIGGVHSMAANASSLETINISNWRSESAYDFTGSFSNCPKLRKLICDNASIKVNRMVDLFYKCAELESIDVSGWDVSNNTSNYSAFNDVTKLRTLIGEHTLSEVENGSIVAFNGLCLSIDFRANPNLERASLLALIKGLKDLSGATSQTLTLGATLIGKLTSDDIAIATNKNWVIA